MNSIDLRVDAKPLKNALKEIQEVTHSKDNDMKPIVTKSNYQCCQNCGCSFITHHHGKNCDYIFYHNQGNESLKRVGCTMLYHKIKPSSRRFVVDTLRKHGCTIKWDGDQWTGIEVMVPKGKEVLPPEYWVKEEIKNETY